MSFAVFYKRFSFVLEYLLQWGKQVPFFRTDPTVKLLPVIAVFLSNWQTSVFGLFSKHCSR